MTAAAATGPASGSPGAASPVGLVADYLIFFRGAERTFAQMAAAFPEAPIYAIAYRRRATDGRFEGRELRTSFMQRLGLTRHWYRFALPLLPRAAESLPVGEHPVLVSSSFGFAHGVRPGPEAVHVCYCHSPFRQAWHEHEHALAATPRPARRYAARTLKRFRAWDLEASRRVTRYVANSAITRERIREYYDRDAELLHPPVEIERFTPAAGPGERFLFVGELVPHKRLEVGLEAVRLAGEKVDVVGAGPELGRLRGRYSDIAEFHGRIADAELERLYPRARALIVPNVEEFGIAAVEAQAAGRPVIALDRGGVRETVVDGSTGVLVERGDPEDFAEAIRATDFDAFDPRAARANAERFSTDRFRDRLRAIVAESAAD